MLFTPSQIEEILLIVDKYTVTFLAHTVGVDILTPQDRLILTNAGFDLKTLSQFANLNVEQAFKFGLLSDALGDPIAKNMAYPQFKKFLESGRFVPLNKMEQGAVDSLKYQTASEVKRNAAGIKSNIEQTLVRIDKNNRAIHSEKVIVAAENAIRDRKSVTQFGLEIGKATGKWNKDLGKIAEYVMHEAFNEGRLASIKRKGSKVYFNVYPGACGHCSRVYLTAGPGSEPKIFEIAELIANGTNIGRIAKEYKPTIGPVHPFCRCTICEFREGYVWNPATQAFSTPGPFKRKVERKSKVTVTVDGKTTTI